MLYSEWGIIYQKVHGLQYIIKSLCHNDKKPAVIYLTRKLLSILTIYHMQAHMVYAWLCGTWLSSQNK